MDEIADLEDEEGNVVGKAWVDPMRVIAPNPRVDEMFANGEAVYLRKRGSAMRMSVSPIKPNKGRRR